MIHIRFSLCAIFAMLPISSGANISQIVEEVHEESARDSIKVSLGGPSETGFSPVPKNASQDFVPEHYHCTKDLGQKTTCRACLISNLNKEHAARFIERLYELRVYPEDLPSMSERPLRKWCMNAHGEGICLHTEFLPIEKKENHK